MDVTVEYTYWDLDVIPPRCRKPRDVRAQASTTVTVPEVSGAQAPVAFRYAPYFGHPVDEYRWWDQRVWAPYRPWSGQHEPTLPGSAQFPDRQSVHARYGPGGSFTALDQVAAQFAHYLVIDGEVWTQTGEPRYEIYTLGLGHNHSGTGFGLVEGFNSNIHRDRYFRLDAARACIAEATRLAIARGDTDSVPRIAAEPLAEVLIPDAVRLDPSQHGEGDPFLNRLYGLSVVASTPGEAGLLTLAALAQELSADR